MERYIKILLCFALICCIGTGGFLAGRMTRGTTLNVYIEASTAGTTLQASRGSYDDSRQWISAEEFSYFASIPQDTQEIHTVDRGGMPQTETSESVQSQQTTTLLTPQVTTATAATWTGKLNINTATQAQLEALPGIGETIAARIITYRGSIGGFKSVEQLDNVEGIGEKRMDALRELVTVG